jgi:hypothetical protein
MHSPSDDPQLMAFVTGKSAHTIALFDHFVTEFHAVGNITLHPAKTMIGISNGEKRIAWITALGGNFIHVVFPFAEPHEENLCFQKIAQVPGQRQFNHHFRMLNTEDVNDELRTFMRKALGK